MKLVLALIALLNVLFITTTQAQFNQLNNWLSQIQFGGVDVMPCPNEANKCDGNVEDFPEFISEIEVCLFELGPIRYCDPISKALVSGYFEIWNLQCGDIFIGDIDISDPVNNQQQIDMLIGLKDLKVDCTGYIRFSNVKLQVKRAGSITLGGEGTFHIDDTQQGTGNSVGFNMEFYSVDYNVAIPNDIIIDTCSADLDLGVNMAVKDTLQKDVNLLGIFDFGVPNIVSDDQLIFFLANIAEGLIGSITCQVIAQGAKLKNGDEGGLNIYLDELQDLLAEWRGSQPTPTAQAEADAAAAMTALQVDNAIDFRDNEIAKVVSVGISNWLNSNVNDASSAYNGKKIVNELVGRLTAPTPGKVEVDLTEYVVGTGLDLGVLSVKFTLNDVALDGIDTFEELDVLQNNYDQDISLRNKWTLNHEIEILAVTLALGVTLVLDEGEWSSPRFPGADTDTEFTFDMSITLEELKVQASTLLALNPKELDEVKAGQLLQAEDILTAAKCGANVVYSTSFTSMSAGVKTVKDGINLNGILDADFNTVVENTANIIAAILKGGFSNDLPGIAQGPVREIVNDLIQEYVIQPVVAGDYSCDNAVWVKQTYTGKDQFFSFDDELVKTALKVVNVGIGGNPIAKSDADVNNAIQQILAFYASNTPEVGQGVDGTWFSTDPDLIAFNGGVEYGTGNNEVLFKVNDIGISGLNSITALQLNPLSDFIFETDVSLGAGTFEGGEVAPELVVYFTFELVIDDLQIDEKHKVEIKLNDLAVHLDIDLKVKINDVMDMIVRKLTTPECVFHLIYSLKVLRTTLFAEALDVDITRLPLGSGADSNELSQALNKLIQDMNGLPSNQFKSMFNYILSGAANQITSLIKYDVSSDLAKHETGLDQCESQAAPWESLTDAVSFASNVTWDDVLQGIQDAVDLPPTLPTLEALESSRVTLPEEANYLQFKDNFIVEIINDLLNSDNTEEISTLQTLILTLANSTGNFLSDRMFIEEKNGEQVVLFAFTLADFALNGDFFGVSEFIPGFSAEGTITIDGINLFSELNLLQPLSMFTTGHHVKFAGTNDLKVNIDLEITVGPEFINATAGVTENIVIDLALADFELDLQTLIAVDLDKLGTMSVNNFLNANEKQEFFINNNTLFCGMSVLYDGGLYVPFLNVSLSNLDFEMSVPTDLLISSSVLETIDALVDVFTFLWLDDLPHITQSAVKDLINDVIIDEMLLVPEVTESCTENYVNLENKFFNFRDSGYINTLQEIVRDYVAANDYNLLNNVMRQLINGEKAFPESSPGGYGGVWLLGDHEEGSSIYKLPLVYDGRAYGSIAFQLANVYVSGIDTFKDLLLFGDSTASPYSFITEFLIGGPMELHFDFTLIVDELFKGQDALRNDLRIKLTFEDLHFLLDLLLKLNINDLMNLEFATFMSIDELPCILKAVEALSVSDFDLAFGDLSLSMICLDTCAECGCDSPLVDRLIGDFQYISDPEDNSIVTELTNQMIEDLSLFLETSTAQSFIDQQISLADEICSRIVGLLEGLLEAPYKKTIDAASVMGIGFLGFSIFMLSTLTCIVPRHFKNRKKMLDKELYLQTTRTDGKGGTQMKTAAELEKAGEYMLIYEDNMMSLFSNPSTPMCIKYVLPIVCFFNIVGLIIAVAFSDATAIILNLTVLGSETQQLYLVPFTVVSTINDMFSSGAWPLGVLIAGASCAWPCIKNAGLIYMWFAPSTILSPNRRHFILELFDYLGKWSFLDVYVIVLMVAGLAVSVPLSNARQLTYLPEEFLIIETNVIPQQGIVLLCLVATSSLICNHIMIYYHDKIKQINTLRANAFKGIDITPAALTRVKLKTHEHKFSLRNAHKNGLQFSPGAVNVLTTIYVIGFLLQLVGFFIPVIEFNYDGLVGVSLELIDPTKSTVNFSLWGLGVAVSDLPIEDTYDTVIAFMFQVLYYASIVIAPVLYTCCVFALWRLPLTYQEKKSLLFATKIISYWNALEVIIVGLVALILEIGQVTAFIVDFITNNYCSVAEPYLTEVINEEDGNCFAVNASLMWIGFAVVLVGSVIQVAGGLTICSITAYITDDLDYIAKLAEGRKNVVKPKFPRNLLIRAILKSMMKKEKTVMDQTDRIGYWKEQFGVSDRAGANSMRSANPSFKGTSSLISTPQMDGDDIDV